MNTTGQEVAVKANIIHLSDSDNYCTGLTHFCQGVDVVERITAL